MKIYTQKIRCANCGKIIDIQRNSSVYIPDMELDGKPISPDQAPRIEECPACGYKNLDLSRRRSADPFENAYYALVSYWHASWEGDGDQAEKLCLEAIQLYDEGFDYKIEAEPLLIYIDLLRKTSNFEMASKIVDTFETSFEMHKESDGMLNKIFQFEKELIKAKDNNPHRVSEIVK